MRRIAVFWAVLVLSEPLSAQFIEDALRFARMDGFPTPRAGALGIGYAGIADDFAALYYNPAGLVLIPSSVELSGGLLFAHNTSRTEFLGTTPVTSASNSTALSHLGAAATQRWNRKTRIGLAIGYILENDYELTLRYGGFNPSSSIIAYWTDQSSRPSSNRAFRLYLADTVGGRLITPVRDSLQQSGFVRERGGMHSLSGGIAFELSQWAALGFSVSLKYGRYRYGRSYTESDVLNRYNWLDTVGFSNVDFDLLELEEELSQEAQGITGSIGLLVRMGEFLRLGLTAAFPTFFQVTEKFSQEATAYFDNGDRRSVRESGENSYNVITPFRFGAAVGLHLPQTGLTFCAAASYNDVTQLEFTDAPPALLRLNRAILEQLVGQTAWGGGIEWTPELLPMSFRVGFTAITSPYQQDIAGATTRIYSTGAALYLQPNLRLDFLLRWVEWSELRSNYGGSLSQYLLHRRPVTIAAGLTYRY